MARGKSKKPRQAEKLLLILLDGHEAGMAEVEATLGSQIEFYRLSTYLWNLRTLGAELKTTKQGRKVVGIQLLNLDTMTAYAQSRGLVAPPVVELKPEDLMVTA